MSLFAQSFNLRLGTDTDCMSTGDRVRDSSFTIYIFLRLGFKQEAEAYMTFVMDRIKQNRTEEGALPIMFDVHGRTDLPEVELDHLDGYRG